MSYSDIVGFCEFEDFYRLVVQSMRPGATLVEVGCAYGRSIALLDELVQASGKPARIIAVDNFSDFMGCDQPRLDEWTKWAVEQKSPLDAFRAALKKHSPGTLERIHVVVSDSAHAAELFADGSLDFVFIDADHNYAPCARDIAAWRGKVRKKRGVLAGDDFAPEYAGVMQAVTEAFPKHETLGRVWTVQP